MSNERESLSPTKVGLGVLWPACWTGLLIKLVFAVLVFSMGILHLENRLGLDFLLLLASPVTIFAVPIIALLLDGNFGEGIGFPLLLLLSIPIDIWALGVVGKTFLLERFRKEPPNGLGFTLWWQSALVGAVLLPLFWYVVSLVTETAISTSHSIAQMESLRLLYDTGLPVAERIGLEVTIWGTVSFLVLSALLTIGVSTIGVNVRRIAAKAEPASDTYQGVITRWDLMRIPGDQGLFLTSVTGAGTVLGVLLWVFMPVTTPHPHDCCKKPEVAAKPPFKPMEVLARSEQEIATISAQIEEIEQSKAAEQAEKQKGGAKAEGRKAPDSPAVTKP